MAEITLVFPHQLFENHPAIVKGRQVALIEDSLFFNQLKFHKKKIMLHRASMKAYEQDLKSKGFRTHYFAAADNPSVAEILENLRSDGFRKVHFADPDDYLLERRITRCVERLEFSVRKYDSPGFICSLSYLDNFFETRHRYFLTDFYIEQRKRLNLLMDGKEPAGGKWTFDTENRKKMPASVKIPPLPAFEFNTFVQEATVYAERYFPDHYGSTEDFQYPVTRSDALTGLRLFLQQRFMNYGIYQDAIVSRNSYLFHSLLTPALNIGLLSPAEILDESIEYAMREKIPINSLEGFVRQVLGWREFIRAVYRREGVKQRKANHWQHHRPIPPSLWTGTTSILPVDNVVHKVLHSAYSNHIERLMVMGNFMLLCEFEPDEVYRWFMELYIDAYDWVMVPNVYGMSQFSDGGLISTKPYVSGSNYLLKMSDFKKGDWCIVWDALYWNFISKHKRSFSRNPRMSMMVRQLEKMDSGKRHALERTRENFLEKLCG